MDILRNKFTIIVPVYNVAKYIRKCIESILNQTYHNWELILVDDGSTDGCEEVLNEYQRQDTRIKVLHKTNGGLSSARNAGLSIASGDWIIHVDGDDYIERNALEILEEKIMSFADKENLDIIWFEHSTDYEDGHRNIHYVENDGYYTEITREEAQRRILDVRSFVCGGCFRREISQKAIFKEHIRRGADTVYVLEIQEYARKILYVQDVLYRYVQSSGSLARSKVTDAQLTVLDSSQCIYDFISKKYPQYMKSALNQYIYTRVTLYYKMYISNYENAGISDELIKTVKEKYVVWKKQEPIDIKRFVQYSFFVFSPKIYCKVFKEIANLIPGQKYMVYKTK